MIFSRSRLRFGLLLLIALVVCGGVPAHAQPVLSAHALTTVAIPHADDTEYVWIAGSAFHTRDGTSGYETATGRSCTSLTSSGELTSDVAIPDGATLISMEAFVNDTSTVPLSGVLRLQDTNGQNTNRALATATISTSAGYVSHLVPIINPASSAVSYTVSMLQNALTLEWLPKVFDQSVQLCGVRISYTPTEPLANPSYHFVAGSGFANRDSATDYGYAGGGCTFVKNAGRFLTADVQLPAGTQIASLTSFYRDASATDLKLSLIEYDGLGISRTLALATEPISSTNYRSIASALAAPYTVTPLTRSLVLQADFGSVLNNSVRFCGARLEYIPSPTAATQNTRFVAGTVFHPRNSGVDYVADEAGCIATDDTQTLDNFTAHVDVPDGATITEIKHFYRNTVGGATNVRLIAVDLQGFKTTLAQTSFLNAETGSITTTLRYKVDTTQRGLVLEWNQGSASAGRFFCGAQVTYKFIETVYLPLIVK